MRYFQNSSGYGCTSNSSHFNTFISAIPNKRMPSRNSPTNIAGKTEETMSKEYIVVMKKESTR
jgi:hypothetical protein